MWIAGVLIYSLDFNHFNLQIERGLNGIRV
jgi:hypothetical protein